MVLGEGAWIYVLEEFDRAKQRGANIYAEIAGYGSTCDAYHRVRLQEGGDEPARAMTLAMNDAGINAESGRLRESARHFDGPERSHRDQCFEAGAEFQFAPRPDVSDQITGGPSAGRERRRRPRGCALRHANAE